nr:putative capsid protein [Cressdnaviricota sp.]
MLVKHKHGGQGYGKLTKFIYNGMQLYRRGQKRRFEGVEEIRKKRKTNPKVHHKSTQTARQKTNVTGDVKVMSSFRSTDIGKTERGSKLGKLIKRHKRRGRKGKKKYKKVHWSHGKKTTLEFWDTAVINGSNQNLTTGYFDIAANTSGHMFIPLLTNNAMEADFKCGESTTGTGLSGFLDPPPSLTLSGGAIGTIAHNLIKKGEAIYVDKMMVRIYIANTGETRFKAEIQEWICAENSQINPVPRANNLYNTQPHTQSQSTADTYVGGVNVIALTSQTLFNNPAFELSKVPKFQKFWKKGLYSRSIELDSGQELQIDIPIKSIYWDRMKYQFEDSNTGAYEYHKGISRFIEVKTTGMLGRDNDNAFKPCFCPHRYNMFYSRTLTAHRIDMFGMPPYQYYCNLPSGFQENYNGSTSNATTTDVLAGTSNHIVVQEGPNMVSEPNHDDL